MFGRSMFRDMDQDPFFAGFNDHMRQADGLFRDPFRGMGMGMLEDGRGQDRGNRARGDRERGNEVAPFGEFGMGFGNMFGNMDKMMSDMNRAFAHASESGNGQSFQQSSFMSYQKSGEGPPKVYQASTATRSGPGGVRETKKALRDSERELEKMSIGHHIRDKGHEIEKHRNTRSGQIDEMQNYINIDEKDVEHFDREWQEKTRTAFKGPDYGERGRRRDDYLDRPAGRRGGRELRDRPRREDRERGKQLALPEPEPRSSNRSEHWGRTAEARGRDRS
ncbi:myeloid leukemia factor 2-like [Ruditapes philippinarum]|uniref:myeloid leukemia factor 2-like n=1 Tax=Ruditapes philippinarum TaxID=129788 RepID=UPI00295B7FCD|nr:myeloid leukemia factor 2-like [Ruditapes philippinarum]